jgi:hypothetical protein
MRAVSNEAFGTCDRRIVQVEPARITMPSPAIIFESQTIGKPLARLSSQACELHEFKEVCGKNLIFDESNRRFTSPSGLGNMLGFVETNWSQGLNINKVFEKLSEDPK